MNIFSVFQRKLTKKMEVEVCKDVAFIAIDEPQWPHKHYDFASAESIGLAMANKVFKMEEENFKLRMEVDRQDKIIVSLKAELGDLARETNKPVERHCGMCAHAPYDINKCFQCKDYSSWEFKP